MLVRSLSAWRTHRVATLQALLCVSRHRGKVHAPSHAPARDLCPSVPTSQLHAERTALRMRTAYTHHELALSRLGESRSGMAADTVVGPLRGVAVADGEESRDSRMKAGRSGTSTGPPR